MSTTRALRGSALSVRLMALLHDYMEAKKNLREWEKIRSEENARQRALDAPAPDLESKKKSEEFAERLRLRVRISMDAIKSIIPTGTAPIGEYHIEDLANSLSVIEDTALTLAADARRLKDAEDGYHATKQRMEGWIESFKKKEFSGLCLEGLEMVLYDDGRVALEEKTITNPDVD